MTMVTVLEMAKIVIAIFASYFPTVAIAGFFAAWVAKKLGDPTAEQEGLLTVNPLEHIRIFGLAVLLMAILIRIPLIVGFGRYVPVNEQNIEQPFRKLKYLLALFAKPLANLLLACFAILTWIVFWQFIGGPYSINSSYPALSGAMELLYKVFIDLNMMAVILELIFGLVVFIMSFILPQISEEKAFVIWVVEIYLLLLSWYFVAPYMREAVQLIKYCFGMLVMSLIRLIG